MVKFQHNKGRKFFRHYYSAPKRMVYKGGDTILARCKILELSFKPVRLAASVFISNRILLCSAYKLIITPCSAYPLVSPIVNILKLTAVSIIFCMYFSSEEETKRMLHSFRPLRELMCLITSCFPPTVFPSMLSRSFPNGLSPSIYKYLYPSWVSFGHSTNFVKL